MPIEIRELTMKATILEDGDRSRDKQHASGLSAMEKEDIIAACVDQVMRILDEKKER